MEAKFGVYISQAFRTIGQKLMHRYMLQKLFDSFNVSVELVAFIGA